MSVLAEFLELVEAYAPEPLFDGAEPRCADNERMADYLIARCYVWANNAASPWVTQLCTPRDLAQILRAKYEWPHGQAHLREGEAACPPPHPTGLVRWHELEPAETQLGIALRCAEAAHNASYFAGPGIEHGHSIRNVGSEAAACLALRVLPLTKQLAQEQCSAETRAAIKRAKNLTAVPTT